MSASRRFARPGTVLGGFGRAVAPLLLVAAAALPVQAQTYKLGVIAPVTGPVASVGARQYSTLQWWEQEVNAKGGINGHKIELLHCDDAGSPETAVTCARDLLSKGIVLLFNSSITGPIRATMPLVANGPVMLTPSPNISPDPSSYVFQVSPTDLENTQAIVTYMKANKLSRIGVIAATDASGEVGLTSVKAAFPAAGIDYSVARIDLRANDASIQLASVAKPDVQLIYAYYSGGGAATVVKSYANLGLTQPLIVNYANISDQFIALIKNDMPSRLLGTGLKAVAPELVTDPAAHAHLMQFITAYKAWKHESVDELNVNALALADTAEAILRNVPNPADAAADKKFLEATPIHSFAIVRFSPQTHVGLGADDVTVLEYKGDRWVEAGPTH